MCISAAGLNDRSMAKAWQTGWLRFGGVTGAVLGILILTACQATAASSPPSPSRVAFGVEPASAYGADGRSNFSFAVTPGAIVFDHVAALNYSAKPLSLQLYATDALETSGGGFGLLPATTTPVGVGSWITIAPQDATVQVPAQSAKGPGEVVVPITVHVPDKASPGDHAGGVVVSLRSVGANASGQTVILNQRVGTRVFVRVSGTSTPRLALSDVQASYLGTSSPFGKGRVRVNYRVTNSGNINLAVTQSVSVSGLLGSKGTVGVAKVGLLLPGASLAESAVVPALWPQLLEHVTVTAHGHATDNSNISAVASATASTTVRAIPWILLGIIALVLLVLIFLLIARSRRETPRHARHGKGAGA